MITISQKILANRISTESSSAYQPNHRKEYQDPETEKVEKKIFLPSNNRIIGKKKY